MKAKKVVAFLLLILISIDLVFTVKDLIGLNEED